MSTLSVIIICKNEERVIEETLSKVHGWADEIIVFDSGSNDSTVEISKKYSPNVFETDWPGYGIQKNRALDKASCDWVLSIDADERVSEKLRKEISCILNQESSINGYRIPVKLFYYGKYVRSLLKSKPLILFRRGKGRFNEPSVHESLTVEGELGKLKNYLLHDSYDSLPHQIFKLNSYANLWSEAESESANGMSGLLSATTHATWTLFKDLFLKLAIADGWRGILLSSIHAQYTFNKYAFCIRNNIKKR